MALKISEGTGKPLAFLLGIFVSLAVGALVDISRSQQIDRYNVSIFYITIACAIMWSLYPEHISLSKKSMYLVAFGIFSGIIYYFIFMMKKNYNIHYSSILDIISYFIYVSIAAPIFEELAVRRLMFLGISNFINPILSALLVSTLFALTHTGMFFFALFASLLLCLATWRKVDTVNRALLHGSYNFIVSILIFRHVL